MFPSVPRLYNKIHAKIKEKFEAMTGCKGWLVNRALDTKTAATRLTGAWTDACYDRLVFKNVSDLLGG